MDMISMKVFACKLMSLKVMRKRNAMEDLRNEIRHLKMCNHPNII